MKTMVNYLKFTALRLPLKNSSDLDPNLLVALISDGVRGDQASFEMRTRRLASQIKKFDKDLAKRLINIIGPQSATRDTARKISPIDSDSKKSLLTEKYPVVVERTPSWKENIKSTLDMVLLERSRAKELLQEGLLPTKSMLFVGPPGVGKTLTANWIAAELNLPLLTLDLATVMSSYLGKTGGNVRSALEYAQTFPCVLLLDEFDAIAKRRDDETDVGELKRLVTVLLQSIDDWRPGSLLIAATNHAELLDPAIWRRFDDVLDFGNADVPQIRNFLTTYGVDPTFANWIAEHVEERSLAILEKRLNQARKKAFLAGEKNNKEFVCEEFALSMSDWIQSRGGERDDKIVDLFEQGMSQRKIAEELGISRQTVKKIIVALKGETDGR